MIMPMRSSRTPELVGSPLAGTDGTTDLESFFDDHGIEMIDRDECLRMLAGVSVARVGLTSGALPLVVPVNIALTTLSAERGPEVMIRTVEGSKLRAALGNAVIAVEADSIDPLSHSGWSVLVRGMGRVITDPAELAEAQELPLRPWALPDADCFVAIGTDVTTGRRIVPWRGGSLAD